MMAWLMPAAASEILVYRANFPPRIDGVASAQEWGTQASATNSGQFYYFRYTGAGLYVLIDRPADTTDDRPTLTWQGSSWSQTGDYFLGRLLFDSDGSGAVTADVDYNYGTCFDFPTVTAPTVGQKVQGRPYLSRIRQVTFQSGGPCGSGGVTGGALAFGFGPTPNAPSVHRFFEVVIPRGEIGGSPRLGVNLSASDPTFPRLRFVDQLDTLSGRVLDAQSAAPLAGATVSVGTVTRQTGGDGSFTFENLSLASDATLQVSKTNYAPGSAAIPGGGQGTIITLPDILLQRGTNLTVTGIEPAGGQIFLAGVTFETEYTAKVAWAGARPGSVEFSNGQGWSEQVATTSDEATIRLDINQVFAPSFRPGANHLQVVAVSEDGQRSDPFTQEVDVIPLPPSLATLANLFAFTIFDNGQISLDAEFPQPPLDAHVDLPVLGRFGFEVGANLSFDYTVEDGEWELALGIGAEKSIGKRGRRPRLPGLTRSPKLKLYLGNKEISGQLAAGAKGTATVSRGITFDELAGTASIEARLELTRYGLLDLLGPGISAAVADVPKLDAIIRGTSIILWATPGFEAKPIWSLNPQFAFKETELTGKCGLEASYEPKVSDFSLRIYAGGEGSVTFNYPPAAFKEFNFRAFAGLEADVWVFTASREFVFLDYTYPGAGSALMSASLPGAAREGAVWRVPVAGPDQGFRPMVRDYLGRGAEQWRAPAADAERGSISPAVSILKSFREIGRTLSPIRREKTAVQSAASGFSLVSLETNQADLALAQNVFPGADPAMASRGEELLLLYVGDNGSSNRFQFTDIRWTRWDGTNWSAAQTIETNSQAEFRPQVAYDGEGNAIAVWERVTDPNFDRDSISAMAGEMQIVWSRWNRASGSWSAPLALTSNAHLDHAPLICGPMADGSVLATWTENHSNLLLGTNGAGSQVLAARWNPATLSWSTPQTLVADLPYRLSQSLAGATNRAIYLWSRDMDGDLITTNDQQLFYCQWTNGAWTTPVQYTAGNLANRNARAAFSANGNIYFV